MGVSISVDGKSITPGWRSMMHQLLIDNFGSGTVRLYKDDIPQIERIRDTQYRGVKEPPFDYADDIAESFNTIIAHLRENDTALIECIN